MKCKICNKKIEVTFMEKFSGTYVKDNKGKLMVICSECQGKLNNDKKKMLENIR